jgi:hypothetical protein
MAVQVVAAAMIEAAAATEGAEAMVVTAMELGHRAAKVTIIGVASQGTRPETKVANSPKRRKRSKHLRPKRRNLHSCSLRLSSWSRRSHTDLAATDGSRTVMQVSVCESKGAGVTAGRTQVPVVHAFQSKGERLRPRRHRATSASLEERGGWCILSRQRYLLHSVMKGRKYPFSGC